MKKQNDNFALYDLQVTVVGNPKEFVCSHEVGEAFFVQGENLIFKKNQKISLYALAALLPLLPAKERKTDANDWMTTDAEVACPDPYCKARFRITRRKMRSFRHSDVTKVPLLKKGNTI